MKIEPIASEEKINLREIGPLRAAECVCPIIISPPYSSHTIKDLLAPEIYCFSWSKDAARASISECPSLSYCILSWRTWPAPSSDVVSPKATIVDAIDPYDVIYTAHYTGVWRSPIDVGVTCSPGIVCHVKGECIFAYDSAVVELSSVQVLSVLKVLTQSQNALIRAIQLAIRDWNP